MEHVVADAYGGALAKPGTKSIDVVLGDGRGIQVKARSLPPGDLRHWSFSDFDFDLAVVVNIDRSTGQIVWAREMTADEVTELALPHAKGGYRLRMSRAPDRGRDVTAALSLAYAALD